MPEQEQFKRNVAFKYRIGELLGGKPIFDTSTERFSFLEIGSKQIVRVNVVGNIVDKYVAEGEKKYIFFTLDDGSGQIKLRVFGDDFQKFQGFEQGQTVVIIGVLRNFNNETYIAPEIIRELNPKYLLIRKLETEKIRGQTSFAQDPQIQRQQTIAVKDKILELIKNSEAEGGIEVDKIIMNPNLKQTTPDLINQEVKKLIEEGIIFEPRPGKLRYLG